MDRYTKGKIGGYMTIEAALVMSVVFMIYLFVIETMLMQYDRCVEELKGARDVVLKVEDNEKMYDVKEVDPVGLLRLQKILTKE